MTLVGWHRLRLAAVREAAGAVLTAPAFSRGLADVGAVRVRPTNRQVNRSPGVDGIAVHRV